MNEIKFDIGDSLAKIGNNTGGSKNKDIKTQERKDPDIMLHLTTMADVYLTETSPNENMKILELKTQIDNNQYRVDDDMLARKLYHNLFNNTLGIGS